MRLSCQHALPSNRLPVALFESRNSYDKRQMVLSLQCKWLYCAHTRHATSRATRAVIKGTKTGERNWTKINLRHDENINHILTFRNISQEGDNHFKLVFALCNSHPISIITRLKRDVRELRREHVNEIISNCTVPNDTGRRCFDIEQSVMYASRAHLCCLSCGVDKFDKNVVYARATWN